MRAILTATRRFGLAGTAILSKIKPLSVSTTLPGHPDPISVKGRIVTLEFEKCWLVGTYVVNAGTGLKVRTVHARVTYQAYTFTIHVHAPSSRLPRRSAAAARTCYLPSIMTGGGARRR